jgi:hypothetical protein
LGELLLELPEPVAPPGIERASARPAPGVPPPQPAVTVDAVEGEVRKLVRLAVATGAVLWLANIDGTTVGPNVSEDEARDLVIDAAGDVVAVGTFEELVVIDEMTTASDHDFAVVKFTSCLV